MGSLSTSEQRKLAYFHALSKAMSENSQTVFQSKYKSSHSVRTGELWSDSIGYAYTFTDAYNESLSNSAVTFYEEMELDMIYGSNGQSYSYISGGTFKDESYPPSERGQVTTGGIFIRPYISPVDVPEYGTNEPSYGYEFKLYRGDDATQGTPSSQIYPTEGAWSVDYYSGIIHFSEGYTPLDLGWGSIKGAFFQYTGLFGGTGSINVDGESIKNVNDKLRGSKSYVQYVNTDVTSGTTSGDTGIVLDYEPVSVVNVYVNGIYYPVSYTINGEPQKPFYFIGKPVMGSILYVNINYLDYELNSNIDLVSIQYSYVDIT